MSWGSKRRNTIIILTFLIALIPTIFIAYKIIYKKPTCFDGKQNGIETGIDCGGACELVCNAETFDPIVLWTRLFEIAPGLYNTIAYIENPNIDAGIMNAKYTFRLFDEDNTLLYERNGRIDIQPKAIIPIIENGLFTNKLRAKRVTFDFTDDFVFEKKAPLEPVLIVKDEELKEGNEPRVEAVLQNISIYPVKNIKTIVILYDSKDNAIGSSSTIIDQIVGGASEPIVFTWPNSFDVPISRLEIIPLYENNF